MAPGDRIEADDLDITPRIGTSAQDHLDPPVGIHITQHGSGTLIVPYIGIHSDGHL